VPPSFPFLLQFPQNRCLSDSSERHRPGGFVRECGPRGGFNRQ
jgi:hypothetical protein